MDSVETLKEIDETITLLKRPADQMKQEEIVGRVEEIATIKRSLNSFKEYGNYNFILVTGSPGTGKTLTVTNVCNKFQEENEGITFFYFNAVKEKNMNEIMQKIMKKTYKTIKQNDFNDLKESFKKLKNKVIVVIDEFDVMMREDKILYKVFEALYDTSPPLMFFLISNSVSFPEEISSRVESRSTHQSILFKFYSVDEIKQIIAKRIGNIIYKIFSLDDLNLFIREKIEDDFSAGDARRSIGLFLNILIKAKERGERGKSIALNKDDVLKMIHSDKTVPSLSQCSKIETIILYCMSNDDIIPSNSILKVIMDNVEFVNKMNDSINIDEQVIRFCLNRLENKNIIKKVILRGGSSEYHLLVDRISITQKLQDYPDLVYTNQKFDDSLYLN